MNNKLLMLQAMVNFIKIFGDENIGSCEVDFEKIYEFVHSPRFNFIEGWSIKSLEECYDII